MSEFERVVAAIQCPNCEGEGGVNFVPAPEYPCGVCDGSGLTEDWLIEMAKLAAEFIREQRSKAVVVSLEERKQ